LFSPVSRPCEGFDRQVSISPCSCRHPRRARDLTVGLPRVSVRGVSACSRHPAHENRLGKGNPLWLPGQTRGSAPTSAHRSYQPPPFSPGVLTLFTLFTLFFNSAKRQFHCKNWYQVIASFFCEAISIINVPCLPSGFAHKYSTNVLFCEGEKMSHNPLLRGGIEGGGGGRRPVPAVDRTGKPGGGGLLVCPVCLFVGRSNR